MNQPIPTRPATVAEMCHDAILALEEVEWSADINHKLPDLFETVEAIQTLCLNLIHDLGQAANEDMRYEPPAGGSCSHHHAAPAIKAIKED